MPTIPDGNKRVGLAIPNHVYDRLKDITRILDITQARLVEAIVSTMSLDELREIMARQEALDKLEATLHLKASKDVLGMVRGRSSDHIRQMAVAADRALDAQST